MMAKIDPQSIDIPPQDIAIEDVWRLPSAFGAPEVGITLTYIPTGQKFLCTETWNRRAHRVQQLLQQLRRKLADDQYAALRAQRYGCFDRPARFCLDVTTRVTAWSEDSQGVVAHDVVSHPFRMAHGCQYTHTALGQKDPKCKGCDRAFVCETQQAA